MTGTDEIGAVVQKNRVVGVLTLLGLIGFAIPWGIFSTWLPAIVISIVAILFTVLLGSNVKVNRAETIARDLATRDLHLWIRHMQIAALTDPRENIPQRRSWGFDVVIANESNQHSIGVTSIILLVGGRDGVALHPTLGKPEGGFITDPPTGTIQEGFVLQPKEPKIGTVLFVYDGNPEQLHGDLGIMLVDSQRKEYQIPIDKDAFDWR